VTFPAVRDEQGSSTINTNYYDRPVGGHFILGWLMMELQPKVRYF